jgi:hypothetical protein
MRFIELDRLRDEVVLARNLPSDRPSGALLLRAGTTVTASLARRIADEGSTGLWIEDELGAGIEPTPEFPADVVGLALHAVGEALAAAPRAIARQRELEPQIVRRLREAGDEIADAVLEYPADQCPLSDMPATVASASWHAVRVALLGAFIALRALTQSGWVDYQGTRRFDRFDERLSTLAFGLLVHDVGVAPPAVPAAGMVPEADQDPAHTSRGSALFAAENTPAAARVVIHSHHERWNGSGYPEGKYGDAAAQNARIAAIADCYDALRASRPGGTPEPIHAAVEQITTADGHLFDPALLAHFTALVPPHQVGHTLVLPDGRDAVVVSLPRGDRLRPTVRLRDGSGAIIELVADMNAARSSALAA